MANKPNMRTMFLPDSDDYIFAEPDLAQADLRIVAAEANELAIRSGRRTTPTDLMCKLADPTCDIHTENAMVVFGVQRSAVTFEQRQDSKRFVHGADYLVGAATLAKTINILIHDADRSIKRWYAANPEIPQWHNFIDRQLQTTRCVSNKFGFRIRFFDRVECLLPEAVAWIPQSTVALTISRGIIAVEDNCPTIIPKLHGHDSFLFCILRRELEALKPRIKQLMTIPIPYDQPLIIPVDLKLADGGFAKDGRRLISWGDVQKAKW